jgi:hypothetical protein
LKQNNEEEFDVSLSENNFQMMKQVFYQTHIRNVFKDECGRKDDKERGKTPLIHLDWACKLIDIRAKFMPDFETLEKRSFQKIHNYLWSSKQIIASSSHKKV